MTLKSIIVPMVTHSMTSEKTFLKNRAKFEKERVKTGKDHIVEFFHDPSDPYSQLLETIIPTFAERYQVQLHQHIVGPPDEGAAPEREKLAEYAKMDAMRLAKKAGLNFEIKDQGPAIDTEVADARREKLGHYLGGMLYYGGEWYWGLDRLHFLEERLIEMGLRKSETGSDFIYAQPDVPADKGKTGVDLHWYASFRSPYTAIVREHVKALADAYGANLKVRIILPMVMRGLPVPPAKKSYIPLDAARDARRLGVPYGRIYDPVGKPVERGYSLLPWARDQGKDYEFANAFLTCAWSEGINPGTNSGMRKIVERAGLDWNEAKGIVGNDDWRTEAEANRAEMMERGIWGVPSFRVGDTITWGQDRLWVIEHALQKLSEGG